MKRWLGVGLLVFVGAAGWRVGDALSPDALSMATGVLFGVMAGVPTALLVMAGARRRSIDEGVKETPPRQHPGHGMPLPGQTNGWGVPYVQQPPVIVIAGTQGVGNTLQPPQSNASWPPQEPTDRHFIVVGEREELVEDLW
jgi:hypothetical protein